MARSLLSPKQCLIYSEIKAKVRPGSTFIWSAAPHKPYVLFSEWKCGETESGEGAVTKPTGKATDENAVLKGAGQGTAAKLTACHTRPCFVYLELILTA